MSAVATEQPENQRIALALPPLAMALIVLLIVFFGIYRTSAVDGGSMLPTLMPEDRLLVTRGYHDPMRGDIVVAVVPGRDGTPQTVVKRVVAVGGDRVSIDGDRVDVNGAPAYAPGAIIGAKTDLEEELVLPEGRLFLLGDNRPVSWDSRFFGSVRLTDIEGRAVAIYAPVTRLGPVDGSPDRD